VALVVGWVRAGYPPRRANSRAAGRAIIGSGSASLKVRRYPTGGRQ